MKKLFFVIAAGALMASCTGNSSKGKEEATDSVATEVKEEAKPDTIKGPATIDNPSWTFEVPEGWYVTKDTKGTDQEHSSLAEIRRLTKPEGYKNSYITVNVSSFPYEHNTVEQAQETFQKSFKAEAAGSVTINGVKYAKSYKEDPRVDNYTTCLSAALQPKGNVSIRVQGFKTDNEEIQTILNSFKIKPTEAKK